STFRWLNIRLSGAFCLLFLGAASLAADVSDQAREAYLLGVRLQSDGKLAEAQSEYLQAIQLDPSVAKYHNNLALVLKDLNQLSPAEKECRAAIKLNPDKASYYFNLGIILTRQNQFALAEPEFRHAIKLEGMDGEFRYRLGQTLSK